ncbi:MAG: hypothetical protein P1U64_00330 [Alcanivoracaceae bacterium]|nr:hypothetical protein [Alcanivoracaceae bacterium]
MDFRVFIFLLVPILPGCTYYNYVPASEDDPKITFGDRFGGDSVSSPARNFLINTAETDYCSDYKPTGVLSNHWSSFGRHKTRDFHVPRGTRIKLIGTYIYSGYSTISTCRAGPISFSPEDGAHYSIDIVTAHGKCGISIVKIGPDGDHSASEEEKSRETECEEKEDDDVTQER